MPPTIYEVSKLAGVSLATVSRVMNNSEKVSPATRKKVEDAMKELGYRPNSNAQSLASNRSNSVGVIVPVLYGPFYGEMLSGVESELRSAGKHHKKPPSQSSTTKLKPIDKGILDIPLPDIKDRRMASERAAIGAV